MSRAFWKALHGSKFPGIEARSGYFSGLLRRLFLLVKYELYLFCCGWLYVVVIAWLYFFVLWVVFFKFELYVPWWEYCVA